MPTVTGILVKNSLSKTALNAIIDQTETELKGLENYRGYALFQLPDLADLPE